MDSQQTRQQQLLLKQNQQQNVSALDTFFSSFATPSDTVLAPHPDLFESELDSSLADFDQLQLQLLAVDQLDPFSFLRSDTPVCGPPSTITSSESTSAYDSVSNHSESFYSSLGFPGFDLDMDFNRHRRMGAAASEYSDYASFAAPQAPSLSVNSNTYTNGSNMHHNGLSTHASYGGLSLPPTSPIMPSGGSVYSDYSNSDYYPPVSSQHPSLRYPGSAQSTTVSPMTLSPPQQDGSHARPNRSHTLQPPHSPMSATLSLPFLTPLTADARAQAVARAQRAASTSPNTSVSSGASASGVAESQAADPRRRYQCKQCPRAFARAYNLKTHIATHDPNRLKAYVCTHHSCGRSFSRKHDLGRHLVSIHRDDPGMASKTAAAAAAALTGSNVPGSGSSAIDTEGEGDSDGYSEEMPRVGVAGLKDGSRSWCEICGKSSASADKPACNCSRIK